MSSAKPGTSEKKPCASPMVYEKSLKHDRRPFGSPEPIDDEVRVPIPFDANSRPRKTCHEAGNNHQPLNMSLLNPEE